MANIKKSSNGGRTKQMTQQSKRFVSLPNDNTITRNMLQDNIVNSEKATVGDMVLVGEIRQMGTLPGTPTPDGHWQDLDGSLISDADSPYNGIRIYNLNGANVTFSVAWTAGVATIADADLNALNVGDSVTGTGITNVNGQPPVITDITGNTVTINDTAASTTFDTTFTNDGIYLGGGSDGSVGDAMQGHYHRVSATSQDRAMASGGVYYGFARTVSDDLTATNGSSLPFTRQPVTDTTNGTPRTNTRTRPHTRFVKMIIRIK